MTTFYIVLGVLIAAAAVYFYAIKTGKIEDADNDLLADSAEDCAEEVEYRAKKAIEELADVKEAAEDLADEVADVVDAVTTPKPKRGRPAGSKNKKSSGSGAGKGKKPAAKKPATRKPRKKSSGSGAGKGKAKK